MSSSWLPTRSTSSRPWWPIPLNNDTLRGVLMLTNATLMRQAPGRSACGARSSTLWRSRRRRRDTSSRDLSLAGHGARAQESLMRATERRPTTPGLLETAATCQTRRDETCGSLKRRVCADPSEISLNPRTLHEPIVSRVRCDSITHSSVAPTFVVFPDQLRVRTVARDPITATRARARGRARVADSDGASAARTRARQCCAPRPVKRGTPQSTTYQ
jgi:hypothetical protein